MNILLCVHQLFPQIKTGTEVLTLELAQGLRKRGHHVQILAGVRERITGRKKTPWITQEDHDGFTIHRLHYGVGHHREPIFYDLTVLDRVTLVLDLVAHLQPDIVHLNHLIGFSGQTIPEIHGMGIPVIFTPTDYWVICPVVSLFRTYERVPCLGPTDVVHCIRCYKRLPKWVARMALKMGMLFRNKLGTNVGNLYALGRRLKVLVDQVNRADKILPGTRFLAEIMVRHGVDPGRIKIVPYGVDVGKLTEKVSIPRRFDEANPLRLGFIGTLSETKGPHVLVDALSFLGSKKDAVLLEIYGELDEINPYSRKLMKKAEPFSKIVRFQGLFSHDKIGIVLRGLHLLIVPSLWYENTPLVLCSALSVGTPVLVSRLGGMMEAVTEGVNGFSFPAGDGQALSKIISRILDDPEILAGIRTHFKRWTRTTSEYARDIETEYLSVIKTGVDQSKVKQEKLFYS